MEKDREHTIVFVAVAVAAVIIIGGLTALFFGLFAGPTIVTVYTPIAPTRMTTSALATETVVAMETEALPTVATLVESEGTREQATAVPDFDPLGTPDPSSAAPTRDAGATLDGLITLLQEELSSNCVDCLRRVMRDGFSLNLYPVGVRSQEAKDAVNQLRHWYLQPESVIAFSDSDAADLLPDEMSVEDLYHGEQPLAAVLYSSGWGLASTGEGLLFITEEDGVYRWAGLTVAYDSFAPLPHLETIAPLPGLVYRLENTWWQVDPTDERQQIIQHQRPLSLNPSATRALYAESGASSLLLIRFQRGEATTIPVDGTLFHGSEEIPWLDDDTAVLIVGPPEKPVLQASVGHLALLDTLTGELTILEPELSVYAYLVVIPGRTINFGTTVWRDGQTKILDVGQYTDVPANAALSPDGAKLAGLVSDDYDRETVAYLIIDLDQQTSIVVHSFTPPPTGAALNWGIHWSLDNQWLALEPPSYDPVESGVWLAAVDGNHKIHLGIGTSDPIWLDAERLVFAAAIDGKTRLQLYDVKAGERFWLDAPVGAQPVQGAPDFLIYWRHWRQEEGTAVSCQQLWIYESGEVKGISCLVKEARQMQQTTLSAEQLAQLQQWIDTLRTSSVGRQSNPASPSHFVDRLVLTGRGAEFPTDAQEAAIIEFARALTVQLGIYREIPNEEIE